MYLNNHYHNLKQNMNIKYNENKFNIKMNKPYINF